MPGRCQRLATLAAVATLTAGLAVACDDEPLTELERHAEELGDEFDELPTELPEAEDEDGAETDGDPDA